MIVDTNILVDSLRGKTEAKHFLGNSETSFSLSVVSVTELYAGLRNARELDQLQNFLNSFVIHPVDEKIAALAGKYLNQNAKSHNIGIADAVIAATATIVGEQLATLNVKDFSMLPDVLKPY
jgi:predicted nucleic acid-binding protein